MRLFLVFLALFFSSHIAAQRVNDSIFCANIVEHECIGAIPSGQSIAMDKLPLIDGYRRLYYWGSLQNTGNTAVAFYFMREGECYTGEIIDLNAPALENVSLPRELGNWLVNLTFGEVIAFLGIQEISIGKGSLKTNIVFAEDSSDNFRVNDWRNVHCPGKFAARLLDSSGNPIPGNNDLRIVVTN